MVTMVDLYGDNWDDNHHGTLLLSNNIHITIVDLHHEIGGIHITIVDLHHEIGRQ